MARESDRRALRSKKSKTRNARPYDRPNQQQNTDQNIFRRVASKVKGLLNPSWIFNVGQWMSTPEVANVTEEEDSADDEDIPQAPSRGSKRQRLNQEERVPSISTEDTHTWDAPSSSLFNQQPPHLTPTVSHTQSSLIGNKESSVIMNGDDHSENSEGSASTSGCSSLVSSHKDRLNCIPPPNIGLVRSPFSNLRGELKDRRDVTSPKDTSMNTSRISLWSGSSTFSPAARLQRRSPSVHNTNQPSFNLSTFAGPSNLNQQDKKVASPFYQGKTTFGGASSSRRMPISVAPYQVDRPPRNQIVVRKRETEDSLEGMSSAAKRILMTLEKMSSPVTDAKKIPNTNRSPVDLSLYYKPSKLRSSISTTRSSTKGPPIADLSTISKLTTLKSCTFRRTTPNMDLFLISTDDKAEVSERLQFNPQPDLSTTTPQPFSGGGKMRCKLTQKHQPSLQKESGSTSLPDVPLPISKLPTFSFEANNNKNAGNDFVFSSPIEIIPKPGMLPSPSVSSSNRERKEKNDFPNQQSFTFSNPIELELPSSVVGNSSAFFPILAANSLPNSNASTATWECSSCWIRNSTQDSKCSACEMPRTVLKPTNFVPSPSSVPPSIWQCQECWINNPSKEIKCLSCETPRHNNNNNITKFPPASVSMATSNTITSTWSCKECWVQNSDNDTSCAACETPREPPSDSSTWECPECWIRNPSKENKCLACEVPKRAENSSKSSSMPNVTDSLMQFDKSGGGFKIPNTLMTSAPKVASFGGFKLPTVPENITNNSSKKIDQVETADSSAAKGSTSSPFSMDTAKPLSKETVLNGPSFGEFSVVSDKEKTNTPLLSTPLAKESLSEKSLSSGFSESGWECDICFVRNTPSKKKCVACETLRPSKDNTPGFKDIESFKLSSPLLNSPMNFKFGALSSTPQTSATSTFSFGAAPSSTTTSSFFIPASTISNTTTSSEQPQSVLAINTTTPKLSVLEFKVDAPKMPAGEETKPSIPIIDLIDQNDNSSDVKKTVSKDLNILSRSGDNLITNTDNDPEIIPVSSSQSCLPKSEIKWPSTVTVKEDNRNSDAQKTDSKTNLAPKETISGGFNFKPPASVGASAFGSFSTVATSNNDSKSTTTTTLSTDSKPSPFAVSTSTTFAFGMPTLTAPAFKVADKVDAAKTSTVVKSLVSSATGFNFTPASSSQLMLPFQTADVKNVSTLPPISTSSFTFGNVAVATTMTQSSTPQSGFSFFASTGGVTTTTNTPAPFTFGASSNGTQPVKSGGFTFKAPNEEKLNPVSSSAINFSTPVTTTTASGVFKFGASSTPSTGSFSFGAVKTEPISAPSSNFTFGSGSTAASNPSTFAAFQTNQLTTPSVFQFGSQQPVTNPIQATAFGTNSGSTFAFGGKNDATNQMSAVAPQASVFGNATVTPMFGGGVGAAAASTPVFGGKTDKPAGFNFSQTANNPVFQFGSVEKKQATGSQFTFGATQETPAASQFQPQFNMSTPSSFNFSAAGSAQGAGPFQFAASSESPSTSSAPRKIRKAIRRVNRKE